MSFGSCGVGAIVREQWVQHMKNESAAKAKTSALGSVNDCVGYCHDLRRLLSGLLADAELAGTVGEKDLAALHHNARDLLRTIYAIEIGLDEVSEHVKGLDEAWDVAGANPAVPAVQLARKAGAR